MKIVKALVMKRHFECIFYYLFHTRFVLLYGLKNNVQFGFSKELKSILQKHKLIKINCIISNAKMINSVVN